VGQTSRGDIRLEQRALSRRRACHAMSSLLDEQLGLGQAGRMSRLWWLRWSSVAYPCHSRSAYVRDNACALSLDKTLSDALHTSLGRHASRWRTNTLVG